MAVRIPVAALARPPPLSTLLPSPGRVFKNATAVCTAMTLGDLTCQTLEWWGSEEDFVWDHMRSFRMGFTGAFVVTPMSFCWNITAERLAPGTSWSSVLKKQVVMILATPPMLVAQFTTLTLLEPGKTTDDVKVKLERDFLPTFSAGLCYWPLFGVVSFRFVPVMNRPAASSLAGLFWSVYLSHRANHDTRLAPLGEASVVHPLVPAATTSSTAGAAVEGEGGESVGGGGSVAAVADRLAGAGSSDRNVQIVDVTAGKDGRSKVAGAAEGGALDGATDAGGGGGGKEDGEQTSPDRRRRKRKFVRRTTVVTL